MYLSQEEFLGSYGLSILGCIYPHARNSLSSRKKQGGEAITNIKPP